MATTKTTLLILFILFISTTLTTTTTTIVDDDEEDLSFLEEPKPGKDYPDYADPSYVPPEGEEYGSYEEYSAWSNPHAPSLASVYEKDVVVLNKTSFDEFVKKIKHVMVQFYAPWCAYCKALAPEYAAVATELKEEGSEVVVAKVDATKESELADLYKVDGFPAIFLFSHGEPKPYNGDRTKDAIISWLKKKTGPAVQNVSTTEEAEKILGVDPKFVVAFVDTLTGSDSEELVAAAKVEDDINFYQTTNPDVAQVFQIDPKGNRPFIVLLKTEDEKLSKFDGSVSKAAILEFVSTNKLPLVINFTRESAALVFENPAIHKQVMLFASADEAIKLVPSLREAAKDFKGKIMFIYVDKDNEEYGKPILDYFGIPRDASKVLAYTANENGQKFLLDGDVTLDNIKTFAEDFLADRLKPYYKSDPIPEKDDGDVRIVVGKNFEEIVLDESKDVLLEVYAPWCPHCAAMEPTYNKLAKHLKGVDSLVVAKMDGTRNEHPRAKVDGYPAIVFFPAGRKSSDPIVVDTERTALALYKFLKNHTTIPFKIQKPIEAPKLDSEEVTPIDYETSTTLENQVSSEDYSKDEL